MRFRRSGRHHSNEAPGEDSFLDIVANLVGVLIILVVVVGANAGSRIHEIAISEVDEAELGDLETQSEQASRHALSLERDNHELENRIIDEQRLADVRLMERDQLLVQLGVARQRLDTMEKEQTLEQQVEWQKSGQLAELNKRFRDLDSQYTSLKTTAVKKETIEHYPTPIAKTVFNEEIHFRLRSGRLAYVPMNELVDMMRDEWKEKARKLEVADETLETVGPIGDFRLQYHLRAENRDVPNAWGGAMERYTEFTRFVMVPVNEEIGDPLEQAFQEHSEFRKWISLSRPDKTTISVWVYPDSYEEFNELKKWLYERGFKTACWPLSANNPISGGPSGYRSTSQ